MSARRRNDEYEDSEASSSSHFQDGNSYGDDSADGQGSYYSDEEEGPSFPARDHAEPQTPSARSQDDNSRSDYGSDTNEDEDENSHEDRKGKHHPSSKFQNGFDSPHSAHRSSAVDDAFDTKAFGEDNGFGKNISFNGDDGFGSDPVFGFGTGGDDDDDDAVGTKTLSNTFAGDAFDGFGFETSAGNDFDTMEMGDAFGFDTKKEKASRNKNTDDGFGIASFDKSNNNDDSFGQGFDDNPSESAEPSESESGKDYSDQPHSDQDFSGRPIEDYEYGIDHPEGDPSGRSQHDDNDQNDDYSVHSGSYSGSGQREGDEDVDHDNSQRSGKDNSFQSDEEDYSRAGQDDHSGRLENDYSSDHDDEAEDQQSRFETNDSSTKGASKSNGFDDAFGRDTFGSKKTSGRGSDRDSNHRDESDSAGFDTDNFAWDTKVAPPKDASQGEENDSKGEFGIDLDFDAKATRGFTASQLHRDSNDGFQGDTPDFGFNTEALDPDELTGSHREEDFTGSQASEENSAEGAFQGSEGFDFDKEAHSDDDHSGSREDEQRGHDDRYQGSFDDGFGFRKEEFAVNDFVGNKRVSKNDGERSGGDSDHFEDLGCGDKQPLSPKDYGDDKDNRIDSEENILPSKDSTNFGSENSLSRTSDHSNQFSGDRSHSNYSKRSANSEVSNSSKNSQAINSTKPSSRGLQSASATVEWEEPSTADRDVNVRDDGSVAESRETKSSRKISVGKALTNGLYDHHKIHDSNHSKRREEYTDEDDTLDDSAFQSGVEQESKVDEAESLQNTGHTEKNSYDGHADILDAHGSQDEFHVSLSEFRDEIEQDLQGESADQGRSTSVGELAQKGRTNAFGPSPISPSENDEMSASKSPSGDQNVKEKPNRPQRTKSFNRYSREQMLKLTSEVNDDGKTKKSRQKKKKSAELIRFVTNVNEVMIYLDEKIAAGEAQDGADSHQLLQGFEALVGIFLQLSDELELMMTFGKGADQAAISALTSLLKFVVPINEVFVQLRPIIEHYFTNETDEETNDLLYGMNLMVDLLCELSHRVGEKQEWNERACTAYATLLELLSRDTLEVVCIFDDVDTPEYQLSVEIEEAWNGTGHIEEFQTLEEAADLSIFRQICYEVILSTDKWCPDTDTLMDICGIEDTMLEEASDGEEIDESELAVTPEMAIQVLDKVNGQPLRRPASLASVLRRVLPGHKISDKSLAEYMGSIRSAMRIPLGLPASNLIGITSIPEVSNDPDSLGVAGVGKTTLAALVADHRDVRRHFSDGIAWIHLGQKELNYTRYIQCLRDLISQLEVPEEEEPAFPELLRTPGESGSQRRRREEGFLVFVRETMISFLKKRSVLVILDDVCFESDLDWFDFGAPSDNPDDEVSACVTLVTTRRRNLLPAADMVEVDMMEESEAATLLVRESGELASSLNANSRETRSVVRECANHPLAVKSVGRWLNLKHATSGDEGNPEALHKEVVESMERILKNGPEVDSDMMYEILNLSLTPAINGEPTAIIKFCYAAYVHVFCNKEHISDFALADVTPIVPLDTVEMLFEAILGLEEETLLKEGSLFYAQKKDAAKLIPTALASLGVFKVITTVPGEREDGKNPDEKEEKYLQIMHIVQQEYGEYLLDQDLSLRDLSVDAEKRWNKAIAKAYLAKKPDWDSNTPDASLDYFLEMMPVHLIRASMLSDAAKLLSDPAFVKGRLFALGRENGTRRHIKDCETLFDLLMKKRASARKKYEPKGMMRDAYQILGNHLNMDEDEFIKEEGSPEAVEVGRCQFEIGFSLAEKRCWDGAIDHWEASQELLVSALGMVEVVAGILYNIGVVYAAMNEYEQALSTLKQCLRVRGTIHGEDHILYAQTIQRIGDVFLSMSDYHEAMESYNWALDVMHIEPSHHRIDIGDILENMGKIHFYKGESDDALQCFQDALQSKQTELGEDHPELSSIYEHIGNCLSDQGKVEDAIAHLEEAIRLKKLDQYGGDETEAEVMTLHGVLSVRQGKQKAGLAAYEKALQILVTKVSHRKEKIATLLHLIASVYLVSGENKKAMKLFEESLQARRKVLGFVHLDVASTLFSMAYLHQKKNRLDKALKCLEESLKIRQLRLPDSEKVAVTHEKIGTIARSIGKLKKAENAFSEALRIRKLIHGENHQAVAKVMQDLGDLMDDLGEYEEAMKNYREAYRIRKSFGGDSLPVAETLYTIGFTYSNSGHYEKALECLDAALKIQKLHLGDDSPECGDTLNMIGFLKAKCGQVDEAQEYLSFALRIRKLQGDNIKTSETLKNIGNAHRSKQEYKSAFETYQECLRIRQKELGREHDKVADALVAIGNVFADLNRPKEAMDSYQEALAIRARLFGHLDSSLAPVLQAMGMLDFYAKNYDRSLQLLNDYISIRNGNDGPRDGDYVNVLFTIGNIYQLREDQPRARKAWTEAYEIFKELGLAESNPEHAQAMEKLMREHGLASAVQDNDDFVEESRHRKGPSVLKRLKQKVKSRTGEGTGKIVRRNKEKGQKL